MPPVFRKETETYMKKLLSGVLTFLIIFTSCVPFVYAESYELSGISVNVSETADFEELKNFKVSKENAADTVEVFIDGKSVITDSTDSAEVTLDISKYITYIGKHDFKIVESGLANSEMNFSAIVTKNIYGDGYSEDYEEYDIGDSNAVKTLDKKSMTIRENGGYAKIAEIDPEHGHSLVYGAENLTETKTPFVGNKTTDSSGVFEYKYELYLEDVSNQMDMVMRYNTTSGNVSIMPMYYIKSGNVQLYNGGSWSVAYTLESQKWYTFRFLIDYDNLKYDLSINGESVAEGNTINMPDFSQMNDQMRVGIMVSAGKSAYAAWDNYVYRSVTAQPYIVNVNGGKALNAGDTSFNAELSNPYADIDAGNISLTANGSEIDIESVSLSGNTLTVNTAYPLSGGRTCELTVKENTEISDGIYSDIDTKCKFDVNPSSDELTDVSLTVSGGKYTFAAKSNKNVKAYIIAKDSDGRFISSNVSDETKDIDISLDAPSVASASAFAAEGGVISGDKIYTLPDNNIQNTGVSSNKAISLSYNNDNKSVIVFGKYAGGCDKALFISVQSVNDPSVVIYDALYTSLSGKYGKEILLPENLNAGEYTVTVTGSESSVSDTFKYINEAELKNALDKINGAEDSSQMQSAIFSNSGALGIDTDALDGNEELFAEIVLANRPDGGYDEKTVMSELNADTAAIAVRGGASLLSELSKYSSSFANADRGYDLANMYSNLNSAAKSNVLADSKSASLTGGKTFADILAESMIMYSVKDASSADDIKTFFECDGFDIFKYASLSSDKYNEITDKDAVYDSLYEERDAASDYKNTLLLFESAVSGRYDYEKSPNSPINFPSVSSDLKAVMNADDLSEINAVATDPNGTVVKVELLFDGEVIDTAYTAPYVLSAEGKISGYGTHTISVSATDNDGNVTVKDYTVNIINSIKVVKFATDFSEFKPYSEEAISELNSSDKLIINTNGQDSFAEIRDMGAEHGNALVYGKNSGKKADKAPFVGNRTTASRGIYEYKFDLYLSRTDLNSYLNTRYTDTSGNNAFVGTAQVSGGRLYLKNNGANDASVELKANEWHTFDLIYDFTNRTYDFYWDGKLIADDYGLGFKNFASMNDHSRLELYVNNIPENEEGYYAWDNYSFTQYVDFPYVKNVYVKDSDEKSVDYKADKYNILLSEGFESIDSSKIKIYRDGINIPIKSVSVSGSANEIITVEPEYPLVSSAEYKIVFSDGLKTLDGYEIGKETTGIFKTTTSDFDIENAEFLKQDSYVTFKAKLVNTSFEAKKATAVMNIYSNDGVYKASVSKKISVYAESSEDFSITKSALSDLGGASNYRAKVFFMDDFDSKTPLNQNIYTSDSEAESVYESDKSDTLKAAVSYSDSARALTINGTTPVGAENVVYVMVAKNESGAPSEAEKPIISEACVSRSNGAFAVSVKLPEDFDGGKYRVYVLSGSDSVSDTFIFVNKSEEGDILSKINSSDKSGIKTILDSSCEKIGLDSEIYKADSSLASAMLYALKPTGGYTADSVGGAVSQISAAILIKNGADISDTLLKYKDALTVYDGNTKIIDCFEDYKSLSEENKKAFLKNLNAIDLANGDSYALSFKKALVCTCFKNSANWYELKQIVLGEDENGNKINSDFGLIGASVTDYNRLKDKNTVFENMYKNKSQVSDFAGIAKLFEKEAYSAYKSENSGSGSSVGGGGGGGGSSKNPTVAPPDVNPGGPYVSQKAYSDIGGHWAEKTITELKAKGIINGYSDNTFRPDNTITRAEFVKLIVTAFGINSASDTSFADVADSAWYAPYVKKAAGAGIANGNNNGNFNPDSAITRQDAAVIIYRYLSKNYTLAEIKNEFTDTSAMADYAKDAVNILKASGVVGGVGDDIFAPSDSITRAQAATMIMNVIGYSQAH